MSIFSIGLTGLAAARAALETATHNIANVNTPGYHRQVTSQANRLPEFQGFGFVGAGVDMTAVNRMYDRYLDRQVHNATAGNASAQTELRYLTQVEDLMGDPATSLGGAMDDFFRAMQGVSKDPQNISARQTVVNQAQSMAGRFQMMHNRLDEMRKGLNSQLDSTVQSVNSIAKEIASLNVQIMSLPKEAGRTPNDLLDRRDYQVQQLNQMISAKVTVQGDGSYSVFIGNGQGLVVGASTSELATVPSVDDPEQLQIAYKTPAGNVVLPNNLLGGGALGGLINTKQETLNRSQADLGRMAIEISDQINRQASVGRDLYNQPGVNIFNDLNAYRPNSVGSGTPPETLNSQMIKFRSAASRFAVSIQDPSQVAAASPIKASLPASGSTTPFISSIWQVAEGSNGAAIPSFTGPVTLSYTPGANPPFSAPGFTVSSSTAASGGFRMDDGNGLIVEFKPEQLGPNADTFTLDAKGLGVAHPDATPGDSSNMLEMIKVQTKSTMSTTPSGFTDFNPAAGAANTTNFAGFYGQLVGFVGNKTNVMTLSGDAQAVNLKETILARESFSGVNLDEEAQNLIRFQQAYQASSKSIQIASQLFNDILSIGR